MALTAAQLAPAIENAVFRNYIEKGMRIFTPHMFIAEEIGSPAIVLSALFALSAAGVLNEQIALRDKATHEIIFQGRLGEIAPARESNSSLQDVEATYAFEIVDAYVAMRLEAEIENATA